MSIKKSIKRKSSKKSSKVPKTKEAFKSHLSFHFKNLRNPEIEYEAHYVSQGITGKWFDIQTDSGNTHFYEDEAWAIFRKNAEFDDIFKGLRPYDIHDIARFSKPNFRDYQKWSDREFLRELSLHPDWLAYPETGATTRLISVVKTARITNTDEAREARENLQECFIPKRPHRKRSFPENLEEALFLLKKLSKYISSNCKRFLREGDIDDEYVELQEWGKIEEPRIVNMSARDLDLLVYHPVPFAEKKLSQELYVSIAALRSKLYK